MLIHPPYTHTHTHRMLHRCTDQLEKKNTYKFSMNYRYIFHSTTNTQVVVIVTFNKCFHTEIHENEQEAYW